jgi:diguanylate cyclase (GGDEF)-like protein
LGGLLVIEALRSQGNASTTLRVCIFTLVAGWPLAGMAWRMGVWLRTTMRSSRLRIALMLLPVALTLGLFLVRAILVVVGTDATTVNFDQGSQFDLIAGMLFLVVLGFFNFSIAGLVIGSLVERLRTLSATDQLTGMANRRVMMRRLVEEHARFLRSSHVYSVVMMDLDHFKRVNDTHGHAVGDQVLKGLSTLLQNGQRQTDTLARMGGEEFMLLMPMTDLDGALAHAKRLCEKVANAALATSAGVQHITLSLGVAEAGLDDVSADIVVSRADAALYRAKAGGRNRVESAARVVMPGWVL